MNRLDELSAALEAKREADAKYVKRPFLAQHSVKAWADEVYYALLTDDTIAALIAVAEAADEVAWIFEDADVTDVQRFRLTLLTDALAPLVKEADSD